MPTKTVAEVAQDLRTFIKTLSASPAIRILDLKIGRAASKAQIERARKAGGTPDELLELYGVMNGVTMSWAFHDSKRPDGELLIPTLGRNVKGWKGVFAWEEDEDGALGHGTRLVDEAPIVQGCRLQPLYLGAHEFGVWNTYGDIFSDAGSNLCCYLQAGMDSLFVRKWFETHAASGELSPVAVAARKRLGMQPLS